MSSSSTETSALRATFEKWSRASGGKQGEALVRHLNGLLVHQRINFHGFEELVHLWLTGLLLATASWLARLGSVSFARVSPAETRFLSVLVRPTVSVLIVLSVTFGDQQKPSSLCQGEVARVLADAGWRQGPVSVSRIDLELQMSDAFDLSFVLLRNHPYVNFHKFGDGPESYCAKAGCAVSEMDSQSSYYWLKRMPEFYSNSLSFDAETVLQNEPSSIASLLLNFCFYQRQLLGLVLGEKCFLGLFLGLVAGGRFGVTQKSSLKPTKRVT